MLKTCIWKKSFHLGGTPKQAYKQTKKTDVGLWKELASCGGNFVLHWVHAVQKTKTLVFLDFLLLYKLNNGFHFE